MQDIRQPLNKTAFEQALKKRGFTQVALAEKIGANEKSFSRWINEGYVQTQYLWDLTEELNLTDEELDEILLVPKYRVFFRRKYLGEVPPEIESRAIELAKTLFGLTYLSSNARFCPPNTSKLNDPTEVANQIRRYTKIESFVDLTGLVTSLADQGVEVAVIPFDELKLNSDGQLETAFSVTDEKRCLIFLDANEPAEALIFNLCHELCHLFRPDLDFSKNEERFCQAVAAELAYPKAFFDTHKDKINSVLESRSIEAIVHLLNNIKNHLGGEIFGIVLRLKALGFLSQKDPIHQRIVSFGEASNKKLPKVKETLFVDFMTSNRNAFIKFWNRPDINSNTLFRFFFHIKNGATDESVSSRKFAELFGIKIGLADEMIHKWRSDLQRSLADAQNG
jgi:Zn-dependent peptidase ImmA (M78 family)